MESPTTDKSVKDPLFLDGVGFSHLRTETAIQTEAEDPGTLAIVHLSITGTTLCGVGTRDRRSAVKVQIGGHPAYVYGISKVRNLG